MKTLGNAPPAAGEPIAGLDNHPPAPGRPIALPHNRPPAPGRPIAASHNRPPAGGEPIAASRNRLPARGKPFAGARNRVIPPGEPIAGQVFALPAPKSPFSDKIALLEEKCRISSTCRGIAAAGIVSAAPAATQVTSNPEEPCLATKPPVPTRIVSPFALVPKLRLGMPLRSETVFRRRGCLRARSRGASGPQTPPPRAMELPPQVRSQTEFGNEV
jgi:hypothetical protein